MDKSTLELGELTWIEARDILRETRLAILPAGATEAHGPHLPLETDVIIAVHAAEQAAHRLHAEGIGCLVLPPLPYGITFVGRPFAGTITLQPDTLAAVTRDVCLGAAEHGIRGIVVMSAHLEPIHLATLKRVAQEVEAGGQVKVRVPDCRDPEWAQRLTPEFQAGARHAGAYETSLVLAVRPGLVREDQMQALPPVWVDLPKAIANGARTFAEAGSELAYFGDPTKASVEEGEVCYDGLAYMLVETCKQLLEEISNE